MPTCFTAPTSSAQSALGGAFCDAGSILYDRTVTVCDRIVGSGPAVRPRSGTGLRRVAVQAAVLRSAVHHHVCLPPHGRVQP